MQKQSIHDLIEYSDARFNPKVLANEPGYRMVLLCLRADQSVPEHSTPGKVTVYVVRGHVTFYEGNVPCDLRTAEAVTVEPGALHRVEAHEDSALLVLATGAPAATQERIEEIDVRTIPPAQRHPLIFAKFDALTVGSSVRLVNDHDPIPLNRQFESLRPGQFSWDYIERGPALFQVRIRRIAKKSETDTPLAAPPTHVQLQAK